MENNFKWTDELVKEFVDFYTKSQNTFASWGQDIVEKFKKSKLKQPLFKESFSRTEVLNILEEIKNKLDLS